MNIAAPLPDPVPASTAQTPAFRKVILRLVKRSSERRAIEAGEVDAIVDPASGKVILMPEAQSALIAHADRLRSLAGLVSDWFWEQDEKHCFVQHSGASVASNVSGLEGLIGKTLWDLSIDSMSPVDWQAHRQQLLWRVIFRDLEVSCVDGSGILRHLTISGEPIFDAQDQFKGYRGIMRDITQRKQHEAVAQQRNRFSREVLDGLDSQVGVLDAQGVIVFANHAWREFAATHRGVGAHAADRTNYLDACVDAQGDERVDGVAIAAGIRQVIAGSRKLFRYEHACAGDASPCWVGLSVTGIATDGGERALVMRADITERKRGELLLALELEVARCLAQARSARGAQQDVIRAVCTSQGWNCGRYFRLDAAAGVLIFEESWGVADAAVETFLRESSGMVIRKDAGLKGRVCQSGLPLWVTHGTRDAQDKRIAAMALAPATGEEGACVFPVTADDKTIGVLAFSSPTVREPDDRMLQAVKSIGSQLGGFLLRQQALDALRQSEARYHRLTEMSCDWYWEQDRNFRFVRVDGQGLPGNGGVIGKTHWELPNILLDDAQWTEHRAQLGERWSFCDFEFAVRLADGQVGYHRMSGEPIYDEAGKFSGYRGTGLDITAQKRADLALRESEARLRAIVEISST